MRHKRTCACALYRPLLGFWVKLKVSKPGRGEERKAQDGQCSGGPITSQPVNMSVFYGYFELYPLALGGEVVFLATLVSQLLLHPVISGVMHA